MKNNEIEKLLNEIDQLTEIFVNNLPPLLYKDDVKKVITQFKDRKEIR